MVEEDQWDRVLQKVRQQTGQIAAALNLQMPGVDGDWCDVSRAFPTSKSEAHFWGQEQWQEAFETLVSTVNTPPTLADVL